MLDAMLYTRRATRIRIVFRVLQSAITFRRMEMASKEDSSVHCKKVRSMRIV